MDDEPGIGRAVLAHIPEHGLSRVARDDVEVLRIVQDDTGILAAAFEDDPLQVALGGVFEEFAPDIG